MERMVPVSYFTVFFWGIAVLFGLIGLGRLVARLTGEELAEKAGWGLHAAWGTAVLLFVGGVLATFGACGQIAITVIIALGVVTTILAIVRAGRPTRASLAAMPWVLWPAFAYVAFQFSAGLHWQGNVNAADDFPSYYVFCEKLLTTGSFPEPFSWRRLASLGGHTLLQSTMLAHGWWANAQAFEAAICPVILLGLVTGFRGGTLGRGPLGLFIALLAITTSILRVNTASHATGIILFAGLFVTLDLISLLPSERRLRLYAVAGLVAAGLASLRAQNIPAAGGAVGLFWLLSWIKDHPQPRVAIMEAVGWGVALFAGMLPWMFMCWSSNGSPLYPLFQGGNNSVFNPQMADGPWQVRLTPTAQAILHPTILPLLLCLFGSPDWKRGLAAKVTVFAGVLTSLAMAYAVSLAPDDSTIPRYAQPLLVPASLAVLMTAAVTPRRRWVAAGLGVILLVTSLPQRGNHFMRYFIACSQTKGLNMEVRAQTVADYVQAQELVPKDKRIMACTDFPYLFNHPRNPVWSIDLPNACSPPPGLPFKKPPEETKRYFQSLGIEYLIFVNAEKSVVLYNRKVWEKHLHGDVLLWKIQAPFYLDFFDTMERLAATEEVVGKVGNLTVVHLKP